MVKPTIPAHLLLRRTTSPEQQDVLEAASRSPSPQIDFRSDNVAVAALAYAQLGWAVLPLHTIRDGACTCAAGAH